MHNHYQKAALLLEEIKSNSTGNSYQQLRHKAKNVVEIYGDDKYKVRFNTMVTFRIHDYRSDHEKFKVILKAIDSAIHYYQIKGAIPEVSFTRTTEPDNIKQNSSKSVSGKLIPIILSIIVVVLIFFIYNNLVGFNWHLTISQCVIIGIVVILFVFNFFKHKVDDKWLAVCLALISIFFEKMLKILGSVFD